MPTPPITPTEEPDDIDSDIDRLLRRVGDELRRREGEDLKLQQMCDRVMARIFPD